jgi:ubiquinone biosynthesis protein COQ9
MRAMNKSIISVIRRRSRFVAFTQNKCFVYRMNRNLFITREFATQTFNSITLESETSFKQDEDISSLKRKILDTAIDQFVPIHGWTEEALTQSVQFHGLSPMSQSQFFEKSQVDLIQHFITRSNQHMSEYVQMVDKSTMTERDILKLAIKTRLEQVAPFVSNGTWTDAMSSYIIGPRGPFDVVNQIINELTTSTSSTNFDQQSNIFTRNATYQLAILADEICFLMGQHKDTDMNWYAKRAAIAGIYASTEIFMLTDKSPGFTDTWEFLDRRIDNALMLKGPWDAVNNAANFWLEQLSTIWGVKK